jgi:hypothetical protein
MAIGEDDAGAAAREDAGGRGSGRTCTDDQRVGAQDSHRPSMYQ